MRALQTAFMSEDSLITECASKIANHLERQIVKHRNNQELANRLSAMNKYIQVSYLMDCSSSLENRLSA